MARLHQQQLGGLTVYPSKNVGLMVAYIYNIIIIIVIYIYNHIYIYIHTYVTMHLCVCVLFDMLDT